MTLLDRLEDFIEDNRVYLQILMGVAFFGTWGAAIAEMGFMGVALGIPMGLMSVVFTGIVSFATFVFVDGIVGLLRRKQ